MRAEEFEPSHPTCLRVWQQLSVEARQGRLDVALQRKSVIDQVTDWVKSGQDSESRAVKRLEPPVHRSTYRGWAASFRAHGLDGLLDWRMPPSDSSVTEPLRATICTLRRADPNVDVEDIVGHIAEHHHHTLSESSVKRVLSQAGLSRRRGPAKAAAGAGTERRLELGGMKLIEAAVVHTGYLESLASGVIGQRDTQTQAKGQVAAADNSDRDELGRFLSSYNERNRKDEQDVIGPGFASVELKREQAQPSRFHIAKASHEVVQRKLLALLVSPLLGNGRWDGIRVPKGQLLEELCGYAYMPSTLDLFTRELKYLGVSNTLWEIHARQWLEQSRHWGTGRQAMSIYVDETNKPLWTNLWSQATAVSSVGRVMPGLDTVGFHTGYGVPLWFTTYSGRAPLVNVVPELMNRLEANLDGAQIGRIVVIDAEGNSVPFLKGLEQGEPKRAWVTRLKPSLLKDKRIFNRNNYRQYRNGDRVRMGECDLNDPDGGTFRIRVVEVERRSNKKITYLGASTRLLEPEWKPQEIADLYFDRWPYQEANFRAVNQAAGLKKVHGYGKQLVDNVTVVTRLDKLTAHIGRLEERQAKLSEQQDKHRGALAETKLANKAQQRRHEAVTKYLDNRMAGGKQITPKLRSAVKEQRILAEKMSKNASKIQQLEQKLEEEASRATELDADLDEKRAKRQELESRRTILKHDVELDSLFSLFKVGLVLLVTFVLKEYLANARMEPITFLERLATLPARLRTTPQLEILTFEYNKRDPDIMALVAQHAEQINSRRLRMLSGRVLQIRVEPAPPPRRPPPKTQRVKTGDRFHPG